MKPIDIIQIVTAIAVLAGLGLVYVELRQSKDIARAQLFSDGWLESIQHDMVIMGENSASVIQRACLEPEEMSLQELTILNKYFGSLMSQPLRLYSLGQTGVIDAEVWKVSTPYEEIMSTRYGLVWWEQVAADWMEPEIKTYGDKVFERLKSQPPLCKTIYVDAWKSETLRFIRENDAQAP